MRCIQASWLDRGGSKVALATALGWGLVASSAMAQDQAADDGQAAEVDDSIIIVTATRRVQDVQDIPLAVTAVGPAQLEAQGVDNVTGLTQVAPSFSTSSAQNASGTNVFRIRGVGTTSNNIGFESAVGVFVDGAYQSRPGVALSEFVDVERVEVLRGPQGTLFGRNTSAGALNVINRRPDLDEFGGFVNASYGNYELMNLQGAINVPVSPGSVALRLTGAWRERDGFVDVVDAAGTKIGESNEIDRWLVRGQIGFGTDSGIEGRIIADYSKNTATCCAPVELLQSGVETAGLFGLVGLGPRGGMASPLVATNPTDQTTAEQALGNRVSTLSYLPTADIDNWGVTVEITFPIGDSADLIYIGSYREFESLELADSDFSDIDVFNNFGNNTSIETMTHELRLQGEAWGGRLEWLVGAYYSTEDIRQTADLRLGQDFDAFASAIFAGATAPITGGAGAFFTAAGNGLPGLNPRAPLAFLSGGADPATARAFSSVAQDSTSWSIFTHNTLEIADGLDVTLGLRYSDESKDGSYEQLSASNNTCLGFLNGGNARLAQVLGAAGVPGPAIPTVAGQLGPTAFVLSCFPFVAPALGDTIPAPLPRPFADTFNDEELIYTIKLGYEFGNVNSYASFTHGYKSGGFNLDATAAVLGADPRFASEEVDAYEIGIKGRFLDGAVTANLAVFHEEFSNFQVLEFTGAQFQTFNVSLAKTTGFELETLIRPSPSFTVNASLTYANARYPGDCATAADSLRVQNLCGFALTNAPEIVAIVGANWERELGSTMKLVLNGQVRTESDRRTSTQARAVPTTPAQLGATALLPFDVQDGKAKINLRAGLSQIDDQWGIEAWVTNLTNVTTRGVTFSTTLRSGSRSAFPQEPRMYGLTLRGKF